VKFQGASSFFASLLAAQLSLPQIIATKNHFWSDKKPHLDGEKEARAFFFFSLAVFCREAKIPIVQPSSKRGFLSFHFSQKPFCMRKKTGWFFFLKQETSIFGW